MDAWLVDAGLNVEAFTASVTDLLVEGGLLTLPVSSCESTTGP